MIDGTSPGPPRRGSTPRMAGGGASPDARSTRQR